MRKLLIAAATTALFAAPAEATDLFNGAKDARTRALSWTGFYLQGSVGGGSATTKAGVPGFEFDGIGSEGALAGARLGFDKQIGNALFVGLFIGGDYSDITTEASFGGSSFDVGIDYLYEAGLRLGAKLNERTAAYGSIAYTMMEVEGPSGLDFDEWQGWTFGGGIETHLGGGWFGNVEGQFTQFEEEQIEGLDLEASLLRIRAGVSYKFGAGLSTLN